MIHLQRDEFVIMYVLGWCLVSHAGSSTRLDGAEEAVLKVFCQNLQRKPSQASVQVISYQHIFAAHQHFINTQQLLSIPLHKISMETLFFPSPTKKKEKSGLATQTTHHLCKNSFCAFIYLFHAMDL